MNLLNNQAKYNEVKEATILKLNDHKVDWLQWGKGSSKTIEHLIKEILDNETILKENTEKLLVRKLSIAYIDVYYIHSNGECLRLVEEKQVFKDGRTRCRQLEGSIAEKLQGSEKADSNLISRAIKEELGISSFVPSTYKGCREVIEDSLSFPGLVMNAINHYFEVYLNQDQYQPNGYIERQEDKDTFFVWKKATPIKTYPDSES